MSGIQLRPYQRDFVSAVEAGIKRGVRRQLAVAPTGSGKTVVFSEIVRRRADKPVLILAHRDELLQQARDKLVSVAPELAMSTGLVKAGSNDVGAPVVVASIQTLARTSRLEQLPQHFGTVIIDEAHHAAADSYQRVLEWVDAELVLGVTATPKRADGKSLEESFDELVFARSIEEMIEEGYLCAPRGKRITVDVDLDSVKKSHGDFQSDALAAALEEAGTPAEVLATYLEHGEDRKAIGFAPNVAMAHHMAEVFQGAGLAAEAVDGTTPAEERAGILRRLYTGEAQIVFNVGVLTEGFDEPSVSCIILAAPTKSEVKYTQIIGRGLRLYPGKTDCIAEGQRVLTDVGLVPIEKVTTSMRVWDGVEFVSHAGAICKGEQDVVTYAGLTATPDHNAWTADGWRPFGECAAEGIEIALTGDGRSPLREAGGHRRGASDRERSASVEGPMHGLRGGRPPRPGCVARRPRGVQEVRQPTARAEVALSPLQLGEESLHEPERQGLPALWRSGDRVPIRVTAGDGALGAGELGPAQRKGDRPDRQLRPLRGGEPAVRDACAEPGQQPQAEDQRRVSRLPARAPGDPLRGRDVAPASTSRDDAGADHREVQPAVGKAKGRVWDLLNAGPRHRFTVEGLLVSNCLILDVAGASEDKSIQSLPVLFGLESLLDGETVTQARQREAREAEAAERREAKQAEAQRDAKAERRRRNAESIRFFSRERMNWTTVSERWTIPLNKDETLVLWPEAGERYDVLLVNGTAEKFRFLARGLDLGYAMGAAEETIRERGNKLLADAQAAWREDPVTAGQRRYLGKLGLRVPATKGEAADLLSEATMAKLLERLEVAIVEREAETREAVLA